MLVNQVLNGRNNRQLCQVVRITGRSEENSRGRKAPREKQQVRRGRERGELNVGKYPSLIGTELFYLMHSPRCSGTLDYPEGLA